MALFSIPICDLRAYSHGTSGERVDFINTVGDALRDVGFFAVTGHAIQAKEIEAAYAAVASLFDLPLSTKTRYEIPGIKGQRGYTRFGREHAKGHAAPDLKEFWHIGQELESEHRLASVYSPNVWPDDLANFKTIMQRLYQDLESAALVLLEACSHYLGEAPGVLRDIGVDGDSILRLIHYPPIPSDCDPQSMRAAAHEDINLITLLIEATDSGLELLGRDQLWLPVKTPKDCIIVDAGDMLQNLTNGYFRSTTHRVVNPENSRSRRLSMPFFMHARGEVAIDPLASCLAKTGGAAAYPKMTAAHFLQQRLHEIGLS